MDPEARLTLEYLKVYPLEAARQLESWSIADIATVIRPLPTQAIVPVMEQFLADLAAAVLNLLPREQAVDIIATLPTASAIGIMRQFDASGQAELFAGLDPTVGPSLRLNLAYPDGTAASLADPRVVTLPPDIPVSTALERIRHDAQRATYYHYVLERDGVLVGLVTTKELLVAEDSQLVASIMRDEVETVKADASEEELLQDPNWRLYHTLPVVDRRGHFLGALRYRTLRRIEAQSEIQPASGTLPQALLQMWEVYALIGLRIMTDLAQVVETGVVDLNPQNGKEGETSDATPPKTP